jgi:hypothetical protein
MKSVLFVFCALFLSQSAQSHISLQVGDLLLQPLNCWSCSLIESEEGTIYSHMGLVISVDPVLVAESISAVHAIPLKSFAAKTEKGQRLTVMRIKNRRALLKFKNSGVELRRQFIRFAGKRFDGEFLWNNTDENGDELLYCSEFITKLLTSFLEMEMPMKRMHFEKNRLDWEEYFNGKVPDGEWGNSPSDYYRSELFEVVGEL